MKRWLFVSLTVAHMAISIAFALLLLFYYQWPSLVIRVVLSILILVSGSLIGVKRLRRLIHVPKG